MIQSWFQTLYNRLGWSYQLDRSYFSRWFEWLVKDQTWCWNVYGYLLNPSLPSTLWVDVWTHNHLLTRPLGGPNTDPHKVFGWFWKTRGRKNTRKSEVSWLVSSEPSLKIRLQTFALAIFKEPKHPPGKNKCIHTPLVFWRLQSSCVCLSKVIVYGMIPWVIHQFGRAFKQI